MSSEAERELVRVVSALCEQFGGGPVRAWVLVTEERSVAPNRTGGVTVGPVVDATAAVRRMVRSHATAGA
ncbi:MAG: hypothetical protein ABMA64_11085 [Myxococcota bacterium]